MKKKIFIQLNEINFEIVNKYLKNYKLKIKNFHKITSTFKSFETYGEESYHELEPWIQWVSVFTGKKYAEHKIFRLGDIVNNKDVNQIFEVMENKGYKVGAIAPMNAENRLKNSSYFIPDPWTDTVSDNSFFSKRVSRMLRQTVNDNGSNKITLSSIFTIFEIIFKTFRIRQSPFLIKLIFSSFFKPWKKSLVLDYLISLLHIYLLNKKKPDFSCVFLNSGAHIQHHYLFNSKYINNSFKNPSWYIDANADPILDMLEVYDKILGDCLKFYNKNHQILIATGLRQVPYDKIKFYYRLKNHQNFLNKLGIEYSKVLTRMTRDFEIKFQNTEQMLNALKILKETYVKKNNELIFKEIEERNKSLFITLNYSLEITKSDIIVFDKNKELNLYSEVIFLAIKNGMHDSKGYVFGSPNIGIGFPNKPIHISGLNQIILNS